MKLLAIKIILIIIILILLLKTSQYIESFSPSYICPINDSVDYESYNQLYNKYRQYFNRYYLVQEGQRRNKLREIELARLKNELYDGLKNNSLTPKRKVLLQREVDANLWQKNIHQDIDSSTGRHRNTQDIITDYNPNIIGCPRQWMECHKWIK